MFVNRETELSTLEGLYRSGKPKLIMLYGRRRIGKTALLQEFAKEHAGLYFLARQEAERDQLKGFSGALADYFGDEALRLSPLQNCDAFFTYLRDRLPEGVPVFFDEFPFMVEANPSLPSVLQGYWDNHFQKRRSFIVLCGSSVRMMERLAGYKSPIYGRRTEQMLLAPLAFSGARRLMGKVPVGKAVEFYAVLGGTPAYLQLFDYGRTLKENLVEGFLPKTAFLNQDALFILREELDEPRNYFSILHSLSKGNTTLAAITNDTGLERSLIAKYLSTLMDLHIAERRVPVTERRGARSRKGIYQVSDPYFRFWFRFVFENMAYLEAAGPKKTFEDRIAPGFNSYVGSVFEDVALEWLRSRKEMAGYALGRWWEKAEEIDIAGLDERNRRLLLAEVKWSGLSERDARRVFNALAGKATRVDWQKSDRKTTLGLIAKRMDGKEGFREEGFLAFDLEDMAGGGVKP